MDGLEKLIGARCDVFAKMLYLKVAKNIDHCKLTLLDFHSLFAPLMVSKTLPLTDFYTVILSFFSKIWLRNV